MRELQQEKILLKAEIAACKLQLKKDFHHIEEKLKPLALVLNFAKKILIPDQSKGLVEHAARSLAGAASHALFRNYSGPVKFLLTYLSKNTAGSYIHTYGTELFEKLTSWLSRLKKDSSVPDEKTV